MSRKSSLLKIGSGVALIAGLFSMQSVNAASVATIEGRAVGSFCCVVDNQGNIDVGVWDEATQSTVSSSGSTQFSITNNDDGVAPPATTAKITWGSASNASTDPSYLSDVNYFEFDGNGSDFGSLAGTTEADSLFRIGTFDYYNAATKQDKVSQVSFNLDMEVIDGMSMIFPTLQFDIAIDNTADNNDPVASMDTATIVGAYMIGADGSLNSIMGPMGFTLDGVDFEFMLAGFAITDADSNFITDENGNPFTSSTSAYENSLTTAGIYGIITQVSAVPVPAAVWLFGSGLLGLAAFARRKK